MNASSIGPVPFDFRFDRADGRLVDACVGVFRLSDAAIAGRIAETVEIAVVVDGALIGASRFYAVIESAYLSGTVAAELEIFAAARAFTWGEAFVVFADHAFSAADFAAFFATHGLFFGANDAAVAVFEAFLCVGAADVVDAAGGFAVFTGFFTFAFFRADFVFRADIAVAGGNAAIARHTSVCIEVTDIAFFAADIVADGVGARLACVIDADLIL